MDLLRKTCQGSNKRRNIFHIQAVSAVKEPLSVKNLSQNSNRRMHSSGSAARLQMMCYIAMLYDSLIKS